MSEGGGPPVEDASDAADVAALYREFFSQLRAAVRRKFGAGPPDPEDAAQAAFARYAALPKRTEIRSPKAFLYRSAINYVLDQRRRAATSERAAADVAELAYGAPPAETDPSRVIEARADLAAVVAAIEALEPRRRNVLIMHSIHGLSCAEIARRMGLSPTRVIQLYAQALAACEKALNEQDGGLE